MSVIISTTEFKDYFFRDWTYSGSVYPTTEENVTDVDVQNAIDNALQVFNQDIYTNETIGKKALLYLSAHFLKIDLDSANGQGQSVYNQTSRSVLGISESLDLPEWMKQGEFAWYSTTSYGQRWLMLTKPFLDGVIICVEGMTQV